MPARTKEEMQLGMVHICIITTLVRLRQGDCSEFEVSLSYQVFEGSLGHRVRPCLKMKQQNKQQQNE